MFRRIGHTRCVVRKGGRTRWWCSGNDRCSIDDKRRWRTTSRMSMGMRSMASNVRIAQTDDRWFAGGEHKTSVVLRPVRKGARVCFEASNEDETRNVVADHHCLKNGLSQTESVVEKLFPRSRRFLGSCVANRLDQALVHMVPKNFSTSVPESYFPFAKWQCATAVIGSACFVLSTQSLLLAVGLGAGALPVAATINWIMKDGIGQLGGVLFASMINNRFDSDPKRWRFVAAVAQDAAMFLEACTPLVPSLFLPMAAVANIGKNVSWLTASATKASIHLSFAERDNLADITAKSGSQSTVCATIGTTMGIAVAALVVGDAGPAVLLPCLGAMSALHLFCLQRSLSAVQLATLNRQRTEILAQDFVERVVGRRAHGGGGGSSSSSSSSSSSESVRALTPSQVSNDEVFVGFCGTYLFRGYDSRSMLSPQLREGFDLTRLTFDSGNDDEADGIERLIHRLQTRRYAIVRANDAFHVAGGGENHTNVGEVSELVLTMSDQATSRDFLKAMLEATYFRTTQRRLNAEKNSYSARSGDQLASVLSSDNFIDAHGDEFCDALGTAGWKTGSIFVEHQGRRIVLPTATPKGGGSK